jgi:hypothetical protein
VASITVRAVESGQTPVTVESVKLTTEAGEEVVAPGGAVARVIVGPAEQRQEVKP